VLIVSCPFVLVLVFVLEKTVLARLMKFLALFRLCMSFTAFTKACVNPYMLSIGLYKEMVLLWQIMRTKAITRLLRNFGILRKAFMLREIDETKNCGEDNVPRESA
jgi:hypothetical protein